MNLMIHGRPATMIALLRRPETRDAVVAALSGIPSLAVHVHLDELGLHWVEKLLRNGPDLLFVEVDMASAADLAAIEALKARCPAHVPLLVTAGRPTVEGLRLLLRLGIADLQPLPIDANLLLDGIHAAIRTARTRGAAEEDGPRGQVTTFLKAGGGVGATSLAVNAACALVGHGQPEADTCLLDLDIQFGACAMHLDVDHATSMVDMAENAGRFDHTLLRSAMARHRGGLDLLPAPAELYPLDSVMPEAAATLVHAAALDYRHVVVELPSSWTAWTRAVLSETTAIVLVLRPEVPSIRLARRQIETLAAEGCGEIPLTVVANFCAAGPFEQNRIDLAEAARALGRPVDHAIPRADRLFATAANEGVPLAEIKGGRRVAAKVARLIRAVTASRVRT